mmetsp:Transcript_18307/g.33471  ORF Transcript_18307/g.33471 Transcript_18307/m.33471 type:complete len:123 (+) Transcript_18307:124-492(+)
MESSNATQHSAAAPPPPVAREQEDGENRNDYNNMSSMICRRTIQRIIKTALATTGIVARGYTVRARRHRLIFVATCIERQLYNAAPTYDDYTNLDTLNKRMSRVVTALIVHEQRNGGGRTLI